MHRTGLTPPRPPVAVPPAKNDVYAKLREANVLSLDQVRCVVLETTGDISVMHGDPDGPPISGELLQGVVGAEAVTRSVEGVAAD